MSASRYQIVKHGGDKYVNYKIYVKTNELVWFVFRRYSEFHILYKEMNKMFPDRKFKIPPKKLFNNFSQKTIAERLEGLNALVEQVLETPGATQTKIAVDFFRIPPKSERELDPDLQPSLQDFTFKNCIGKGGFGKVYMAEQSETKKIFAVKVIVKKNLTDKQKEQVMSERNVLIHNKHPFLVGLHYSFQNPAKLYLVMDFINGGELFFHVQKEGRFSEQRAKFYAAEIACALGYLHSQKILYRDLKPENVLLDKLGHIKLTDFGMAKEDMQLVEESFTNTFAGTPEYLAPEVLLMKPYTHSVDWWCLGCVLFEMICGSPPFYDTNRNHMFQKIKFMPFQMPARRASSVCESFLERILNKDPFQRLGAINDFSEISDHPFFESIDFEKLEKLEITPPWIPDVTEGSLVNIDPIFVGSPVREDGSGGTIAAIVSPNSGNNFVGFTWAPPLILDSVYQE